MCNKLAKNWEIVVPMKKTRKNLKVLLFYSCLGFIQTWRTFLVWLKNVTDVSISIFICRNKQIVEETRSSFYWQLFQGNCIVKVTTKKKIGRFFIVEINSLSFLGFFFVFTVSHFFPMYVTEPCITRNNTTKVLSSLTKLFKPTICLICLIFMVLEMWQKTNWRILCFPSFLQTFRSRSLESVFLFDLKSHQLYLSNTCRNGGFLWHTVGLRLCEESVNLWLICRAHQKAWVLYIIGWRQAKHPNIDWGFNSLWVNTIMSAQAAIGQHGPD